MRSASAICVVGCLAIAATVLAPVASAADDERRNPRIIGGKTALEGEYPFAISIQLPGKAAASERHACGGTLISTRVVLTAAHCVDSSPFPDDPWPRNAVVSVAGQDIDRPHAWETRIEDVALHPKWDPRRVRFDAALVELKHPAPAGTSTVSPAGPGDEALWAPGEPVRAIGWGIGNPDGGKLQQATLSIVSDEACQRAYPGEGEHPIGEPRFDPVSQVCARGVRQSVCFGDSGGPILAHDGERFKQVGIVSWGKSLICNPSAAPDVFTRLAPMHDFVTDPTPTYRPRVRREPKVKGKARRGERLRCRRAAFRNDPRSVRYSWWRKETILGGLTVVHSVHRGRRYVPRNADVGDKLWCQAKARNQGGAAVAASRKTPKIP